MNQRELDQGRYLGDGVYASFDGYQIWLAANDHRNKVVALEPEVFAALRVYVDDLKEHLKEQREKGEQTDGSV